MEAILYAAAVVAIVGGVVLAVVRSEERVQQIRGSGSGSWWAGDSPYVPRTPTKRTPAKRSSSGGSSSGSSSSSSADSSCSSTSSCSSSCGSSCGGGGGCS
ncbi:hypothetical protein ACIRNI_05265 [Streptomyces sp. NPDC093546]|uniref:hypothetical protein n=1 Tax=Streptomyces sp. NPDC093546 TaxID=3366040 RepID=UPI003800DF27